MSAFFATLLILHVILGVVGVIASFMVAFMLLRPIIPHGNVIRASVTAFLSYAISWFVGGWYYWKHYGKATTDGIVYPRGRIVAGDYSWAHYIFTEAKEHAFMFLPFAALALAIMLYYKLGLIQADSKLRQAAFVLALAIAIVGTVITLSGILMSGAAR